MGDFWLAQYSTLTLGKIQSWIKQILTFFYYLGNRVNNLLMRALMKYDQFWQESEISNQFNSSPYN